MEHDRLGAPGYLDRAIWVAGVGDVGRIGARAERWLARHELNRLAALEAVADSVGFWSDLPDIGEESVARRLGDAVPVESRHDAQLRRHRLRQATQCFRHLATFLGRRRRLADRQFIAGLELAALEASKPAERVGRARAENYRHINSTGDGNVCARALLEEIEGESLTALHLEVGPGLAQEPIDPRRQLSPRDGDHGVIGELEIRAHEDCLENGSSFIIAHKQVGGCERMTVHATGERNAEVIVAGTSMVLDRSRKTWL